MHIFCLNKNVHILFTLTAVEHPKEGFLPISFKNSNNWLDYVLDKMKRN